MDHSPYHRMNSALKSFESSVCDTCGKKAILHGCQDARLPELEPFMYGQSIVIVQPLVQTVITDLGHLQSMFQGLVFKRAV